MEFAVDDEAASEIVGALRAAGCVFADDETRLLIAEASSTAELDRLVAARISGEPLEYLLGWAEFLGLRLTVERGVFVPRRRTEYLALEAIRCARSAETASPVLVDLCCGVGAVAAATIEAGIGAEVYAADIDPVAVGCARHNVGARGQAVEGDLFAALPAELRGRIDVIVANAPYVPTGEIVMMPSEARNHEARTALDGGPDGLDVGRRIAAGAPDWLTRAGQLLVETSERQAETASGIFAAAGLKPRILRSADHDSTIVIGSR
ncbi:putative protein N(5)-glutamine methyltransferase [Spelaeicoccus albus]|uniref:peptide chain release factor N(5)-glutamine methyltransferase n=1 Tax=Spelaeicoccus albus TaxID=1280376 RepID=A0A7Z0D1G5_9MICO|nr:putative protein N(5)-glutamine methyltransferase [Spelaeicoccus albus]NYI66222.1 release factor glutamine methyltransferase [Spelaeicoccus albus]